MLNIVNIPCHAVKHNMIRILGNMSFTAQYPTHSSHGRWADNFKRAYKRGDETLQHCRISRS